MDDDVYGGLDRQDGAVFHETETDRIHTHQMDAQYVLEAYFQ